MPQIIGGKGCFLMIKKGLAKAGNYMDRKVNVNLTMMDRILSFLLCRNDILVTKQTFFSQCYNCLQRKKTN